MSKNIELILGGIFNVLAIDVAVKIDHSRYASHNKQKTHDDLAKVISAVSEAIISPDPETAPPNAIEPSITTPACRRFVRKYKMRGHCFTGNT